MFSSAVGLRPLLRAKRSGPGLRPGSDRRLRVSRSRVWLMAIRPATLPAAVGPVLVGLGVAIGLGVFRPLPALATLAVAVLLQIAANLANDLFDFRSGADNADRLGPPRVAALGLARPTPACRRDGAGPAGGGTDRALPRLHRRRHVPGARGAGDRQPARVHRRPVAVRVPRPGRGLRLRVLRARGGRRHGVPAAGALGTAGAGRRRARRCPRDGDPGRQQPARHHHGRAGGQADTRRGARGARRGRRVRGAARGGATWSRSC